MEGMDGTTGAKLAGIDHLRQSIRDILTTRIGTRVMRRDYGSDLPGLIDRPMSPGLTSTPLLLPGKLRKGKVSRGSMPARAVNGRGMGRRIS